jgi:hypothetical protein
MESAGDELTHLKRFESGTAVIVVLHSPREKIFGVLDEIGAAGVFLRGIELSAFEDWMRALASDEPFVGFSSNFFPMWRIERVTLDEAAAGVPSLGEQFAARTGRSIYEM